MTQMWHVGLVIDLGEVTPKTWDTCVLAEDKPSAVRRATILAENRFGEDILVEVDFIEEATEPERDH